VGGAVLLACQCMPRFCASVTRCNFAPWYGDRGLVTSLIIQESSASYNASWPDCLTVCAAQLMLHADGTAVANNASGTEAEHPAKEAFLACCVWFRMQLSVEDPRRASLECCMLYTEQRSRRSSAYTLEQAEQDKISCCVNSSLLTRSFEDFDSESLLCDRHCAAVPLEGVGDSKGLQCSCFHFLGAGKWTSSEGSEVKHLPAECAWEQCIFRFLDYQIWNRRHEWMRELMRQEVFASSLSPSSSSASNRNNTTLREELMDVLSAAQIDAQLALLIRDPLIRTVEEFLRELYLAAATPFHLPKQVFRQDGGVQCCSRPDGLCLVDWCMDCHEWSGGSYNCPPQPCKHGPSLVTLSLSFRPGQLLYLIPEQMPPSLSFLVGGDLVATTRIQEVLLLKFEKLYSALSRLGFQVDSLEEMNTRQRMYHKWETQISQHVPLLPRPPVSAYKAEEGNLPLTSSLDFFRERQQFRDYITKGHNGHGKQGQDPDPGARQYVKRRPMCRQASAQRPTESQYARAAWLHKLDSWASSRSHPSANGLVQWKHDFAAWRRRFELEHRQLLQHLQYEQQLQHLQYEQPSALHAPTPLGRHWDYPQPSTLNPQPSTPDPRMPLGRHWDSAYPESVPVSSL
jgi:hypothetical protein